MEERKERKRKERRKVRRKKKSEGERGRDKTTKESLKKEKKTGGEIESENGKRKECGHLSLRVGGEETFRFFVT